MLRKVIRGSLRTQRKRTRRFLFNASCLIFFYYYVQRFFYTKKLNAVLINSVCSFNWGSFKSEDFVRNSANLFFFLILWNCWFFVSAMKLYSLTVGRLHILLSIKLAFHYIYFILLFYYFFFAKRWVIFVWNLRHYVQFGISVQISSHLMRKSFLGHHNTTFKVGKDDMQVLWFSLPKILRFWM